MKTVHHAISDVMTTVKPKVLNGERPKVSDRTFNHVAIDLLRPIVDAENVRNFIITAIKDGAP